MKTSQQQEINLKSKQKNKIMKHIDFFNKLQNTWLFIKNENNDATKMETDENHEK